MDPTVAQSSIQKNPLTQPPTPSHSPLPRKIILFLLVISVISILAYTLLNLKLKQQGSQIANTSKQIINNKIASGTKQWINCNDIRDIIEENDVLYVTCLGGVLVVEANSGKITDQITMTQGLSNNVATSLVKDGNTLYIGTQDGFTVFNLRSRQAKKVSIEQGLISGANIVLAQDGNDLWVGSFEGLSRYSINNGKIQNFTQELADNSTKYNASQILITPNAVYAIVLANSDTPGGVARWDKVTQKWERFGPSAFPASSEGSERYLRVDLSNLAQVGDKVFVTTDDMIWEAEDKENTTWKKLASVVTQLGGTSFLFHLVGGETRLGIVLSNNLYYYSPASGEVKMVYPKYSEGENVLADINLYLDIFPKRNGRKIWISRAPWLRWLDIGTLRSGSVTLKGRPKNISDVVSVIDNKPLFYEDGGIWKYYSITDEFKELSGLKDFTSENPVFEPIPNSERVLIFSQSCGQGCNEPKFAIYNYKDGSIKIIQIPTDISSKLIAGNFEGTSNYYSLSYEGFDYDKQNFTFSVETEKESLVLNANEYTLFIAENQSKEIENDKRTQISCNKNYEFETNGQKFKQPQCTQDIESQPYTWEFDSVKVWRVDKKTNERTELQVPRTQAPYSPFGPSFNDSFIIREVIYTNGKVWIGSSRGLSIYDPKEKSWQLITTKDGLISNSVADFIVDKNLVWVVSDWGGLSRIVY